VAGVGAREEGILAILVRLGYPLFTNVCCDKIVCNLAAIAAKTGAFKGTLVIVPGTPKVKQVIVDSPCSISCKIPTS
jgi:hypothetical protein